MSAGNDPGPGGDRHDRLMQEEIHDPYQARGKLSEPTVCPGCGAVYHKGRWQWKVDYIGDADEVMCPACKRIEDNMPAGILTLSGAFLDGHKDEILKLVQHKVEEEKAGHPLKRLMAIEDGPEGDVVLTFTDTHLPRGTGQAIERAYDGNLDIQYTKESNLVRVYWRRD